MIDKIRSYKDGLEDGFIFNQEIIKEIERIKGDLEKLKQKLQEKNDKCEFKAVKS